VTGLLLLLLLLQVDGSVLLHVWCPLAPSSYPSVPPLVALSCPQLQPGSLLQLTHKLATACVGLCGDPMVHELAVQLSEGLEQAAAQQDMQPPPPFNQPIGQNSAASSKQKSAGVSSSEGAEGVDEVDDGYTAEAAQHAAAAEALLGPSAASSTIGSSSAGPRSVSSVSSSSSGRGPRRRGGPQLSPQQQAAESIRLQDYLKRLQVC
jgi:hypothetical protein